MKYDSLNKSRKPVTDVKNRGLVVREEAPVFGVSPGEMKRLTIDVSASLHANIKAGCARQGIKMADAIRELLEDKFGNI